MRSSILLLRQISRPGRIRRHPTSCLQRFPQNSIPATALQRPLAFHRGSISGIRWLSSSFESEDDGFDRRVRFEDLEDLHPKSLKTLRRHGLHHLTEIQEKSYDLILAGRDVVGRARTGTGKVCCYIFSFRISLMTKPLLSRRHFRFYSQHWNESCDNRIRPVEYNC